MAKELVEEKLEMSRMTEHLEGQVFDLNKKVICKIVIIIKSII